MSTDQKHKIPEEKFIDYAKCTQNADIMRKLDAKKQEKVLPLKSDASIILTRRSE